jgi:hypothetical protein
MGWLSPYREQYRPKTGSNHGQRRTAEILANHGTHCFVLNDHVRPQKCNAAGRVVKIGLGLKIGCVAGPHILGFEGKVSGELQSVPGSEMRQSEGPPGGVGSV